MKGQRRYSGSWLLETWSRQRIWEVTLYNLLLSTLVSYAITHNGNIYWPLAQTTTCLYHDEETIISPKTVNRSVRQPARDATRKEGPCKTPRGRKYTCKNANRKCIQDKAWLLSHLIHRNAVWTCERFVLSRMAQGAVYYTALIPEHTYLSI